MVSFIKSVLIFLFVFLKEVSYSLGKGEYYIFFFVLFFNIKFSLLMVIIIIFMYIIGEFGVVMMFGGDILGEIRVVSIVIFNEVEAFNYFKVY